MLFLTWIGKVNKEDEEKETNKKTHNIEYFFLFASHSNKKKNETENKESFLIFNWQSKHQTNKHNIELHKTGGNNYTILLLTHLGVISPVPTF